MNMPLHICPLFNLEHLNNVLTVLSVGVFFTFGIILLLSHRHEMVSMNSPAVNGVAITTTPNEAYEEMKGAAITTTPNEAYEEMKGVAITTTPNEAYGQMQQERGRQEEETPQYEVMCGPTASSPFTQHPLPPVPSPPNAPTESVDEAEEQAVYEPIPGDK